MLAVIVEVRPRAGQWDAYLNHAKMLRPEQEQVPGFIDHILYRSLARTGWILSLANLRDEQSAIEWLSLMSHHEQDKRRGEMIADHRLRVGKVEFDTRIPDGCQILEQRLDGEGAGEGTAVTLIDALQWPDWVNSRNAEEVALYLGFDPYSYGDCISWDVLDAIRSPGSILLVASWKDAASALRFAQSAMVPDDARVRAVRGLRGYPMPGRGEAPRYCREAAGGKTVHCGKKIGANNDG